MYVDSMGKLSLSLKVTKNVQPAEELFSFDNAYLWQKSSKMDLKLARRNFRNALQIPIDFNSLVIVLDTTKPGSRFKNPENKPKYRCSNTPLGKVSGKISLRMNPINNQLITRQACPYVDDYIELSDTQLTTELNEVYYKLADSNIFNSPNRTIILTDSSNENSPAVKILDNLSDSRSLQVVKDEDSAMVSIITYSNT